MKTVTVTTEFEFVVEEGTDPSALEHDIIEDIEHQTGLTVSDSEVNE